MKRRKIPKKHSPHKAQSIRKRLVPKETKEQTIIQYEDSQCMFVDPKGIRCMKHAVGKSSLCKRHNPSAQNHQVQVQSTLLPTNVNSKYNPSTHVLGFIKASQAGKAPVEIAAEFEISQDTLLNWAKTHEDFNQAVEIGKASYEAFWLATGRDNLNTKSFSTPLFKFLTGNTLGYSDKVETKSFNTNIHGVLALPADAAQTAEEWQAAASGSGQVDLDTQDVQEAEIAEDE